MRGKRFQGTTLGYLQLKQLRDMSHELCRYHASTSWETLCVRLPFPEVAEISFGYTDVPVKALEFLSS